jgi:hypothetical protein
MDGFSAAMQKPPCPDSGHNNNNIDKVRVELCVCILQCVVGWVLVIWTLHFDFKMYDRSRLRLFLSFE